MKTLIINGSPRKNGNLIVLLRELATWLEGETEFIHTYYERISPCLDCRYCWHNPGCAIDDGMQAIYRLLDEVDNVILGSPLYFSELTGELLSFASRFQCFYVARRIRKDPAFKLKRKHGAIVITGGGDGITEPAVKSANIILGHINAKSVGTVFSLNTNEIPAAEDGAALAQARELAVRLNELNKNGS